MLEAWSADTKCRCFVPGTFYCAPKAYLFLRKEVMEDKFPATVSEARQRGYRILGVYSEGVAQKWVNKLSREGYAVIECAINGRNKPVREGTKAVWVQAMRDS